MPRLKNIAVGFAAAALVGAGATMVTAPASAAKAYILSSQHYVVIELNHAETLTASRIGVGRVIDATLGNRVGAAPNTDSKYYDAYYERPANARDWNKATGQRVIAEAASHRDGRVIFAIDSTNPTTPLWILQEW